MNAPARRGYSVAVNILVGQSLGPDPEHAFETGIATTVLTVVVGAALGLVLLLVGAPVVRLFSTDPTTTVLATAFVTAFAVASLFQSGYDGFRGSLRGGSDTRGPFVATLVGMFVFLLGVSYAVGLRLGYGVLGVGLAYVLDFAWRFLFLGVVYYRLTWIELGASMMEDRGSAESSPADGT